jgi:Na+-translocating ferredoxin:NAD+ oxidoreductase RnfD subunit
MSAPAVVAVGRPSVRIRGTSYPVLLPTLRDPRLHLAAVIISLQVLGQVAFEFRLSIAQILVAVLTCAVLEVGIALWRQRVILWPASALLTGNGVAFILRVPGTEHGDWWSLHGAWIFAGAAALGLLSKYVIRWRGRHIFNPSNFGLVVCFLTLSAARAEPLDFWWAPMSAWMVLALVIIVAGGFAILRRLRLLHIALAFWLAFAAGIAVLAASGHVMTARWHLGPITGTHFWWVLVTSPEILVFLFFMITDPKTIPEGRTARWVYSVGVGLLATLLIAPHTTEYATKVAVLGALAIVCAVRPVLEWAFPREGAPRLHFPAGRARPATMGAVAVCGALSFAGLVLLAGVPARSSAGSTLTPIEDAVALPEVTIARSTGVASQLDRPTALQIARHIAVDLRTARSSLRQRARRQAAAGATGPWLAELWRQIDAARGGTIVVPAYDVDRVRLWLQPGKNQAPPIAVAELQGTVRHETYGRSAAAVQQVTDAASLEQTIELTLEEGRYKIARFRGAPTLVAPAPTLAGSNGLEGVRLKDVAASVGLAFRHGAFRFDTSLDEPAMMGGGLCWLDYDGDGWQDLYVVNSYSDLDIATWQERGGLPRAALFHNVRGRFENVSRGSGADLQLRGSGCVAADLDLDGDTDLYVTTVGYNVATDGYDALLWNEGDGTFTEGAQAAGIDAAGWHAGATVGDVDGDGRPDLFVTGYADMNREIAGSDAGFPTNHAAVRDRLYLNTGGGNGHATFREVGVEAGIERGRLDHGLGAVFTDATGDGRLDLYVANDLDPNRLYENVADDGAPLGFRLRERGRPAGVADPNAGMGIAADDWNGDGRPDLFVTNSRGQLHAVYRHRLSSDTYADARPSFASAFGTSFTGWGVSWLDLDLDGRLELIVANGAIPVIDLARNAEPLQVLAREGGGRFEDVSRVVGLRKTLRVNGRGLAAADYDNDGDHDVAVNSIGGRLVLLESTGARGHWLEVSFERFSPGARVTAVLPDGRRLTRVVQAGSSYLSSEDPRLHFGLGDATRVEELVVRFPDGGEQRLHDVTADQVVTVSAP